MWDPPPYRRLLHVIRGGARGGVGGAMAPPTFLFYFSFNLIIKIYKLNKNYA